VTHKTLTGTTGVGDGLAFMKLAPQPSRNLGINWLDGRRPEARDAVALFAAAVVSYVVAHTYDLAPKLFQLGIDYAEWEFDDIIFVVFVMSVAMMIYAFRRYRDLSREIKSRIGAELEARKLARHDPLTGLPNRRFFEERLEEYLGAASATHQAAVLMLDLDSFKSVNDTHGHAVGDKALCEFARRVSAIVRADAFLARVGGDAGQLAYLKANGCAAGQGYLFSKAVPAADIPALLTGLPYGSAAARIGVG